MAATGRMRTDASARMAAGVSDLVAGKSYAAIAKKHGVSKRQVRRWAEHEDVKTAIAAARQDAIDELQRIGPRAAGELARLLSSEDERVRLSVVTTILDRIGVIKSERHELEDVTPPRTIEEAKQRIAQLAEKTGGRVVWDEKLIGEEGGDE